MNAIPNKIDHKNHVVIYESELEIMCGAAVAKDNLETGGELYGLFTYEGKPVIYLTTPAGLEAQHGTVKFIQDLQFAQEANRFLFYKYNIVLIGPWHSHHYIGLKTLSGVDIEHSISFATRNNLKSIIHFILTFEGTDRISRNKIVRVNAYILKIGKNFELIPCSIKVLRGISPIRTALTNIPEANILINSAQHHPISYIRYDDYYQKKSDVPATIPANMSKNISRQIKRLPKEIQSNIKIEFKENLIILSIHVHSSGYLYLVYNLNMGMNAVHSVYFCSADKTASPIEITQYSMKLGPWTKIQIIFNSVKKFITNKQKALTNISNT